MWNVMTPYCVGTLKEKKKNTRFAQKSTAGNSSVASERNILYFYLTLSMVPFIIII